MQGCDSSPAEVFAFSLFREGLVRGDYIDFMFLLSRGTGTGLSKGESEIGRLYSSAKPGRALRHRACVLFAHVLLWRVCTAMQGVLLCSHVAVFVMHHWTVALTTFGKHGQDFWDGCQAICRSWISNVDHPGDLRYSLVGTANLKVTCSLSMRAPIDWIFSLGHAGDPAFSGTSSLKMVRCEWQASGPHS
jgi:hypothetical protein